MQLEQLKLRLGIIDTGQDAVLTQLLDEASDLIKNYCNRSDVPQGAQGVVTAIAAILYRRLGCENVTDHGEGGVSERYASGAGIVPQYIFAGINKFRKAGSVA